MHNTDKTLPLFLSTDYQTKQEAVDKRFVIESKQATFLRRLICYLFFRLYLKIFRDDYIAWCRV